MQYTRDGFWSQPLPILEQATTYFSRKRVSWELEKDGCEFELVVNHFESVGLDNLTFDLTQVIMMHIEGKIY